MILKELFDKPYPYRWIEKSDEAWKAEAQLDGNDYLTINFDTTDFNLTEWEVNFQRGGDYDFKPTGAGDEFLVFATVVAAIKEWFKNQRPKPREIFFSGDKEDTTNAESRIRLYDRFARQFAQATGYRVERNEMRMSVSWNFVRPKKKKSVKEVKIDNAKGRGQVPMNQDIDYYGLRVKMRPSTFLKLAAPLASDASDEMKDYIRKGGAIGAPFLIIRVEEGEEPYVKGHEGRNRMKAIMAVEGDAPVETHLFFRGDISRARQLTPEIVARLKKGLRQQVTHQYVSGPLWEEAAGVGIITKQNTTADVKPGETKRQAAKFGNKVDKKNQPPELHKKARRNSNAHVLTNLGLGESMKLNEVFEKKFPWRWFDQTEYRWAATFKSPDGGLFEVFFLPKSRQSPNWIVNFDRDGSHRRSNKGYELPVFATVLDIINEFFNKEFVNSLEFSAFKEGGNQRDDHEGHGSRSKLYSRMVKRFAQKAGLEFAIDDHDPAEVIYLIRKPQNEISENIEANNDIGVQAFAKSLESKYDLKDIWMNDMASRNAIELANIIVKRDAQKRGTGSAVMQEIVDFAEQHGRIIVLDPAIIDKRHGTTSQARLRRFYKRFGFIDNKGRNKDYNFRHLMVRYPENKINESSHQQADIDDVADWLDTIPENLGIKIVYEPISKFEKSIKDMLGTYDEFPQDRKRTNRILKKLKAGEKALPIYVEKNDPHLFAMEGRHRMVAFLLFGMEKIPVAYVWDKTKQESLSEAQEKVYGYKAMKYNPETGEITSGADSRVTKGVKLRKGMTLKMPGKGLFMSTNRDYVEQYYSGHNDHEALIKFEFDPDAITSGNLTDHENEFTVPSARVVDFEVLNHLEESTQLNELFAKTYNWSWDNKAPKLWIASFNDANNEEVLVIFESQSKENTVFEMAFKKHDSIKRTNTGDQFAIISTVMNIANQFLSENTDVEALTFTARREGAAASDPNIRDSRASLYHRLLTKIARENNFEYASRRVARMTEFILRRKVDIHETEIIKPHPNDTLGVKRANMPQVHKDHYPEFIQYLKDHGARVAMRRVHARKLKPVQSEFSDAGVEKMMNNKDASKGTTREKPLIVSSDNYIIDGHHRWLASYNLDEDILIMQFSLPIKQLFQLTKDFKHTTYKDIHESTVNEALKDAYKYDVYFDRPEIAKAKFKTQDGHKVIVSLGMIDAASLADYADFDIRDIGLQSDDIWEFLFKRDGEIDLTNQGDQWRIMATVIAVFRDLVARKKPKAVAFSATKHEGGGKGRLPLYRRMAQAFAQESGFQAKEFDLIDETYFILFAPSINLGENISITGTERHKKEQEKGLAPGSDAWFKHWFSRPYMKREQLEQLKTEAVNYLKGVRNEKKTNRRRTNCNGGSNERRSN